MWNMVEIENNFYHVDVTQDINDKDYVCFNLTDDLIYDKRTVD